jgi:hypothetical protein
MASLVLGHRQEPMLYEFLQVAWRNGGRSPILLHHDSWRKGRQHVQDPGIFFPIFLLFRSPLSAPLSFFMCKEGGRERMVDAVKGYRDAQG